MKNQIVKITALCLCIFMGANVYAQEQPNPKHPNPQSKPVQQGSPKDEYMQKLNEFQPKVNDLLAKAKENASRNPDFSTEVNKLNDMVAAFKSKLDQFDNTPREQQNDYAASLKSDWAAIEAQYNKAVDLGSKNRPNDELEKGKQNNKQIPPK
jgi:peptidoglycan hydrolase CwlO-like protein